MNLYFKCIYIILCFSSFLLADEHTGYVKQIEFSFCMDECGEYYLEAEDGTYIANIMSSSAAISLNQYVGRFVDVVVGDEQWCVECGALPVQQIEIAYDCEDPVACFTDPREGVISEVGYE